MTSCLFLSKRSGIGGAQKRCHVRAEIQLRAVCVFTAPGYIEGVKGYVSMPALQGQDRALKGRGEAGQRVKRETVHTSDMVHIPL